MKTVVTHPFGNQNLRYALMGFKQAGLLHSFHTSIALFGGDVLTHCSRLPLLSELKRRMFDPGLAPFTMSYPYKEAGRQVAGKLKYCPLTRHESGYFSTDQVSQYIDRKTALYLGRINKMKEAAAAVYGYEDACLQSFTVGRKMGLTTLYDLPIGYWRAARAYMETAREQWPNWEGTITAFQDSQQKLARKDEEIAYADRVFVASSFTAKTLQLYPGKLPSIHVIPYGFPDVNWERQHQVCHNKPLKILYAGSLSQRKGIAELFHAIKPLKQFVQLTVIGRIAGTGCKELESFLNQHKWIPSLSHPEMLAHMANHDVLVFPSLFEGFGLVISEAMSQGTPVITTNRTAGPDLIDNGHNGWIVEPGSVMHLQQAIEQLIWNRDLVVEAGIQARRKAALRSWEQYGADLVAAVTGETTMLATTSLRERATFLL